MMLGTLFRRRNIGPLRVSPVGLVFFLVAVGCAATIWVNVDEAKAIQREAYRALEQGRPLAEKSRLEAEKSGRPDPGIRVALKSPAVVEGKAIVLRVVSRDGAYFIECKGDELPQGALPAQCRPGSNLNPLPWPPK